MKMQRIETPGIAHFAYLIVDGDQALLVDPGRFPGPYFEAARNNNARISYILETHRHEDFAMGSVHIAKITDAKIVNGGFDTSGPSDFALEDGATFIMGKLVIKVLHTPGHTPESMSYVVYTEDSEQRPWCVFTGDALFYGTTGRTDLPDEDKSVENAELLHHSVNEKFADLPDTTLVLPAHGLGSVCGSGMAPRPYSSLGEERLYNDVFVLSKEEFGKKRVAKISRVRRFSD